MQTKAPLIYKTAFCLACVFLIIGNASAEINGKVRILLVGDSTTDGGRPYFEKTIEQLLAAEPGLPPVEAINLGLGGETAYGLIQSGRYAKQVAGIPGVDFIFIRYGINDYAKRQPLAENFPKDLTALIERLRADYPKARLIPMTIIPFLNEDQSFEVNSLIKQVAAGEKLDVFDIYPIYLKVLKEQGPYIFNVHTSPLKDIPQKYHQWLLPYTITNSWDGTPRVIAYDNKLDGILGNRPDWYYNDRHPNPGGYYLLAGETAKYLVPLLKNYQPFGTRISK